MLPQKKQIQQRNMVSQLKLIIIYNNFDFIYVKYTTLIAISAA